MISHSEERRLTTDWKLGQYVRIWKNEGYEYGHIETIEDNGLHVWADTEVFPYGVLPTDEVMLVGDDGKEIYCRVTDLEEG